MAHYALVNKDNIVVRVIVCDQDPMNIDIPRKEAEDISGRWLQTSYNTQGGIHYNEDGTPSDQPGLRGNYAGIGYTYSDELDAFISPSPHSSWIMDKTTFRWKPPVDMPADDNLYIWNEKTISWDQVEPRPTPKTNQPSTMPGTVL
jgi:hypothetical protein